MDGITFEPSGILLQRILIDRPVDRRSLYWRAVPFNACSISQPEVTCQGSSLVVGRETTLSFDTYFNSFFEAQWRRYTSLDVIHLRITVKGEGILRVYRRALGRKFLVLEQPITTGQTTTRLPGEAVNFRQYGTLCLEVSAETSDLVFVAGGWWSNVPAPVSVGLAAVFCTFNREAALTRLVNTLVNDPEVAAALARLIVVNQGKPSLRAHPLMQDAALCLGETLAIVEQDNFGGAGGFGRGVLAALDDPATTHAVLLDDDILIEPDSLLRLAAFFAFCRRDMVIGGHMLDLVQPNLLYEAGAIVVGPALVVSYHSTMVSPSTSHPPWRSSPSRVLSTTMAGGAAAFRCRSWRSMECHFPASSAATTWNLACVSTCSAFRPSRYPASPCGTSRSTSNSAIGRLTTRRATC